MSAVKNFGRTCCPVSQMIPLPCPPFRIIIGTATVFARTHCVQAHEVHQIGYRGTIFVWKVSCVVCPLFCWSFSFTTLVDVITLIILFIGRLCTILGASLSSSFCCDATLLDAASWQNLPCCKIGLELASCWHVASLLLQQILTDCYCDSYGLVWGKRSPPT